MTDRKTIALFGAGSGLGASLAARFGRDGYRVALVARRAEPLADRVAELERGGIEAAAFPADLNDLGGIPSLVRSIEEHFGRIDVAVYAPVPSGGGFAPAAELDAAKLESVAAILTLAPVEIAHAVLPGMLGRGSGAFVVVGGLAAVVPIPGLSGVGPLMAATRNYALTLNAEVADKGVVAAAVSIGAFIDRSTGLRSAKEAGMPLAPDLPLIDPDEIAEEIWSIVEHRDRTDVVLPPLPRA